MLLAARGKGNSCPIVFLSLLHIYLFITHPNWTVRDLIVKVITFFTNFKSQSNGSVPQILGLAEDRMYMYMMVLHCL